CINKELYYEIYKCLLFRRRQTRHGELSNNTGVVGEERGENAVASLQIGLETHILLGDLGCMLSGCISTSLCVNPTRLQLSCRLADTCNDSLHGLTDNPVDLLNKSRSLATELARGKPSERSAGVGVVDG